MRSVSLSLGMSCVIFTAPPAFAEGIVRQGAAAAGGTAGAMAGGAVGGPVGGAVGGVVGGAIGKGTAGVIGAIVPGGGKKKRQRKAQAAAQAEPQNQTQAQAAAAAPVIVVQPHADTASERSRDAGDVASEGPAGAHDIPQVE